jgi:hypothetical protein
MVTLRNPLLRGYSPGTISSNIEREIKRGKDPMRAKAAAYREARDEFKRRYPGKHLPAWLTRKGRHHNPRAKRRHSYSRYFVAGSNHKGGPWQTFGEFDSDRYSDPQGQAASAAKVLGRMGMYAKVTRVRSR